MSSDKHFLNWVHTRLELVHGENRGLGHMNKLRCIIDATPESQLTPNLSDKGSMLAKTDLRTSSLMRKFQNKISLLTDQEIETLDQSFKNLARETREIQNMRTKAGVNRYREQINVRKNNILTILNAVK